jgi:hypothetical protein
VGEYARLDKCEAPGLEDVFIKRTNDMKKQILCWLHNVQRPAATEKLLTGKQRRREGTAATFICSFGVWLLLVMTLSGCAAMISKPKAPPASQTFSAKVTSVQKEPVYSSGTQTATRVNVVFQLDDGTTISAHCQGNLFSGLLLPSGWVCRVPALGDGYTAWWRNGSQLYVQGRGSNGEDLSTLFDVVGTSR